MGNENLIRRCIFKEKISELKSKKLMTQDGLLINLQNQKITVRVFLFKIYGQQKPFNKIHF